MKIIFLLLWVSSALALDVFREGDRIILSGRSCNSLAPQVTAMSKWTLRLHENTQTPPKCTCKRNVCRVDVTDVVPKLVQDNQSSVPSNNGPNCWNTSLVGSRILSSLRYTSPEEMHFWMTSPLCRERAASETPQPGDIIAIREDGDEIHGFIHLTPELCFSKNGYSRTAPFAMATPESVFNVYDVPPECRRIQSNANHSKCPVSATYMDCKSMDEYMALQDDITPELREHMESISQLECSVSGMAMTGRGEVGDELFTLTSTVLSSMASLALSNMNNPDLSESQKFIWRGLYYKTNSLIEQMDMILN